MKKFNELKETLRGVKCEATKTVFRELKKRGFRAGLEIGGGSHKGDTFKIVTLINGTYFVISMASSVYCKGWSRGKHKWQYFDDIDEIVMSSTNRKISNPTIKQLAFIDALQKQNGVTEYEKPKTIVDAMEMIDLLKQ